jgi:acetolactate synthase-1/3 small subunit
MTFVVEADERQLRQVQTQLAKLINVTAVENVTNEPTVVRELALVKVSTTSVNRAEILQLVDIYRARIVDVAMGSLVIQITGPEDRVNSLISLLEHFGIQEIVRTGRVAMVRGSGREGNGTVQP